jgi:hypothetical protein
LHYLLDTLNRQVGGIGGPFAAEHRDIPSSLFAAIGCCAHRVKALLLLVRQRIIKSLQRISDNVDRLNDGFEARLSGLESSDRREWNCSRTRRLDGLARPGVCVAQIIKCGELLVVG